MDAQALEKPPGCGSTTRIRARGRKMSIDKEIKSSKPLLFICGSVVLVVGITLVLVWWHDVVVLFKGVIGMALALGGLLLLYMVKE